MLKHKGRKALKKLLRCRECLQGSNEASNGARTEDRGSDVSMGISALRSPRSAHRRTLMPMLTSDPRSSFRAPSDVGFKTIAVSIHRPRFVYKSFEVGLLTNFRKGMIAATARRVNPTGQTLPTRA